MFANHLQIELFEGALESLSVGLSRRCPQLGEQERFYLSHVLSNPSIAAAFAVLILVNFSPSIS